MVKKACSTFDAFFADVSRKGIPRLSANSCHRISMAGLQLLIGILPLYLCHCVFDHLLVRHIALVTNEQFVDSFGGVTVDLLEPLLDIVERVHVRYIVDDADAMGAAVVRGSDGSESLLAGGIPLLEVLEHIPLIEGSSYDL